VIHFVLGNRVELEVYAQYIYELKGPGHCKLHTLSLLHLGSWILFVRGVYRDATPLVIISDLLSDELKIVLVLFIRVVKPSASIRVYYWNSPVCDLTTIKRKILAHLSISFFPCSDYWKYPFTMKYNTTNLLSTGRSGSFTPLNSSPFLALPHSQRRAISFVDNINLNLPSSLRVILGTSTANLIANIAESLACKSLHDITIIAKFTDPEFVESTGIQAKDGYALYWLTSNFIRYYWLKNLSCALGDSLHLYGHSLEHYGFHIKSRYLSHSDCLRVYSSSLVSLDFGSKSSIAALYPRSIYIVSQYGLPVLPCKGETAGNLELFQGLCYQSINESLRVIEYWYSAPEFSYMTAVNTVYAGVSAILRSSIKALGHVS